MLLSAIACGVNKMFAIHNFPLFISTAIVLNLTPGPDTMFIIGRSVASGRNAGIASALGISAGCLFHTMAATFGLSAVLATSAMAFSVVKYAGAAYLIFIGLKALFNRSKNSDIQLQDTRQSNWITFRQGAITNILNPKVALFFLALLPQFVDSGAVNPIPSFLAIGFTFIATGTIWCLIIALCAARFSGWLRENQTASNIVNRVSGGIFVALGLRLAIADRN
jgi:threonine/homoserine/homoserine lactone efflux protein